MRNKLIAAMLLLTVQVNGMDQEMAQEEVRSLETTHHYFESSMEMDGDCSSESSSIEDKNWLQNRVNELNEYYHSESKLKGKNALQDLNKVFDENERKSYFEKLVLEVDVISNDAAMLKYISAAATTIINSQEYDDNLFDYSEVDSPDAVYQPPFLFTLVEALDPITWDYIKRVKQLLPNNRGIVD